MKPSRFRRYWPVLLFLPFLAFGMYRMLIIRPMAVISPRVDRQRADTDRLGRARQYRQLELP